MRYIRLTSLSALAKHGEAVDDGCGVEAEDKLLVVALIIFKVCEGEVAEELPLEECVGLEGLGVVPHAQLDSVFCQRHLDAARHVQSLTGEREYECKKK